MKAEVQKRQRHVEAAMTERQKTTVLKMPKHERDN
jgi:hypothetical protein